MSPRCHHSAEQKKKNPCKKCLSAKKQQWMKRREQQCLANIFSAPGTPGTRLCSPAQDAPAWLAVQPSDLPWVARMSGLPRGAPVLSYKSVTSAPVVPPNFSQPAPSACLVCPPCLALSGTGTPFCSQTKLHCKSLLRDLKNHSAAFSHTDHAKGWCTNFSLIPAPGFIFIPGKPG